VTTAPDAVAAAALARRVQQAIPLSPAARSFAQRTERVNAIALYDCLITDAGLIAATRGLFANRHYASAIEEAYKYINNAVKERSGLGHLDGSSLMETAFSPGSPHLKLNELRSASQRDEQSGYMRIFAGCMVGIRNPRAHEHGHLDQPEVALELLAFANHLARRVAEARRSRAQRSGKKSSRLASS
jgi:uncharacterized protein (TIGR02391 family)